MSRSSLMLGEGEHTEGQEVGKLLMEVEGMPALEEQAVGHCSMTREDPGLCELPLNGQLEQGELLSIATAHCSAREARQVCPPVLKYQCSHAERVHHG